MNIEYFFQIEMESIYNDYKNNIISIDDVYKKCKKFQSKEAALISTCLTLIVAHSHNVMLRKYERVEDLFQNEKTYIYNRLYEESERLAFKFSNKYGSFELIHPVEFHWRYMNNV